MTGTILEVTEWVAIGALGTVFLCLTTIGAFCVGGILIHQFKEHRRGKNSDEMELD